MLLSAANLQISASLKVYGKSSNVFSIDWHFSRCLEVHKLRIRPSISQQFLAATQNQNKRHHSFIEASQHFSNGSVLSSAK